MKITLHFQSTGTVPGNGQPHRMLGNSISVGRSDANDLVLPDPDKIVSGSHCSIENQSDNVMVIDLSTNGTFLNYGKLALGNTPTPLNDGDILSIGSYELLVDIKTSHSLASVKDIVAPVEAAPISHGNAAMGSSVMDVLDGSNSDEEDFLDDLLGEESLTGPASVEREVLGNDGLMPPLARDDIDFMTPLDDPNNGFVASLSSHSSSLEDSFITPSPQISSIPDDWDLGLDLPVDDSKPVVAPVGSDASAFLLDGSFVEEPETVEPPKENMPIETVHKITSEPEGGSRVSQQASRAFLEAAGVANVNVSNDDLIETMVRLGNTFRIMTEGMREILMTRTSIKSEFRINQTVISSGNNNPLKFSVSPQMAMETMVRPPQTGFLASDAAAEQALDDIKAHEVAVMTGMEAAIKGVLMQLSPEKLEKTIVESGGITSFLKNKKAQYWDVFEKQYDKIANQAETDFHHGFTSQGWCDQPGERRIQVRVALSLSNLTAAHVNNLSRGGIGTDDS